MNNPARKKKGNVSGFTLVEMIIVIAILGVLAAIAIPNFSAYTDQARQTTDRQTADIAVNAMAMYCAENRITSSAMTSGQWKTALDTAGLWPTAEQSLTSVYYTDLVLSGPVSGVCTVTLTGEEDYVVTK